MRLPSLAIVALIALPAHGAEEPYGWAFCTDPANGLSLNTCTAHVRADCDGAADQSACLVKHYDAWFRYDANATLADAVDDESHKGRLSLKGLRDAVGRVTPQNGRCADTDVGCLLDDSIKRALGNYALRQAK
ncbi:MAG: hypothetical protein AAGH68_00630 [Pseudomonadota bacterium]